MRATFGRAASFARSEQARLLSIAAVQISGFVSTLCFLLWLDDRAIMLVLAAVAYAGMVSGTVASNNTTKIYAGIANSADRRLISVLTFRLFAFEQLLAISVAILVPFLGLEGLQSLDVVVLVLLASFSSNAAVIAFTKHRERDFVRFNYLRVVATLLRLGLVFLAADLGRIDLIPAVIAASAAPPYLAGLWMLWRTYRASLRIEPTGTGTITATALLIREYVLGIPAALARSFINHGLMIAVVETLPENAVRMFRFLLLLKDVISRFFNAALPLIFDRMYLYRVRFRLIVIITMNSLVVSVIWYTIGIMAISQDWSALPAYVVLFAFNMLSYVALPFVWRAIHHNKAIMSTSVVLLSAGVSVLAYWLQPPGDVSGFLFVMSLFYITWFGCMLILSCADQRANPREP